MNIIAITQKGPGKAENEDRIVIGETLLSDGTMQTSLSAGIVAVADGVGGNRAGAVASRFVVQRLTVLDDISQETFAGINSDLLALSESRADYSDMATTLAGLCIRGDSATLFSVGNSRVYLLQGKKYLKQLTQDDTTLNYLLASGQLSAEEAENFSRRNEITACFGGGTARLFKIKCEPLPPLDTPFLMTSDGIHDHVSIDEMEDIIAQCGLTCSACEALIAAARANGSQDDASVVLGTL